MTKNSYMGVILAAGRGSRMAPFSDNYPKPILPICNKPMIEYQIETMKSLGISDRGSVLAEGEIVLTDTSERILARDDLQSVYFGYRSEDPDKVGA